VPFVSNEKLRLNTLTFVGFFVNAVISEGHADTISFNEIYQSLENGELLEFLDQKIPGRFDFSLFPAGDEQAVALNHVLNNVAGGLQGSEYRKIGIKSSGLHLLMAFILEAIQHHQHWISQVDT
jgi:hypothetical protein